MMVRLPFLYQLRADEMLSFLGKTLVLGGPGMGKSEVLRYIHDELERERKKVRFVRASDSDAFQWIDTWSKNPTKEILLIDDLDHMYDTQIENLFRNLQEGNSTNLNIIATSETPNQSLTVSRRLGLNEKLTQRTFTANPKEGSYLNTIMLDSRGLRSFTPEWLNPWSFGWRERTVERVQETFKTLEMREDLVTHATQLIVSASGGHPYLIGAATNRMFRVLLARERTGSSIAYDAKFGEELDQYLLDSVIPIIFRAMNWAEQQLPPDVFGELLELANLKKLESAPLGGRLILNKAGLVRFESECFESERCVIPCRVIQLCIRNYYTMRANVSAPTLTSRSHIMPHYGKQEKRVELVADNGTLSIRWREGEEAKKVAITPVEKDIIEILATSPHSLVTVPSISQATRRPEVSIRSTLQRLLKKLSLVGLERLIVNVPRRGYLYQGSTVVEEGETL